MFSDYKSIRRAYTPPVTPIRGRKPRPISGSDGDVRIKLNFSPSGILQNFAFPHPFRRRNKSKDRYSDGDVAGTLRPRELIELASFGVVELEPAERGIGHQFQISSLKNPTWCDCCGDFIWGLYNSTDCLRCLNCRYTCHQRCQHLVTLDCKGSSGDTQTTNFSEIIDTLKSDVRERDRLSPLFFEHLDGEELRHRIERYNALHHSSEMVLQEDGETLHGFIRVHMNLTRPINVIAGTRPPSIYDILKEEDDCGRKTLTSFYLPRDTVKALHITSEYSAREVINALLKKFKVADNPHKFALYERTYSNGFNKAKLRRIQDHEIPLLLALYACDEDKHFVLQENETEDIIWEQFAIPELNNFLKILDLEEEEYINQVKLKYKMLHEKIQDVMNTIPQSDISETS
ncbi:ras association domain-containing protein 1 [Parasteatoda tepidariorum]|uniref:ras association domain-containing protein 1 n=1 Tax=Parasteatoda tepidariorum TaxID=114398 RepID=UPI001C7258EF|nr:ras association domain-containing protein 1 homolog [Parasteatoda tepidariorum]XP_015903646.2 ras association domain-containing protein 1 homolog [Parasteatoda tepidariorum]